MEKSSHSSSTSVVEGFASNLQISIYVNPTTGGDFYLIVEPDISVDDFKKLVSKRLKVPKDKISLLFRDKQLQGGTLSQNGIYDGSRITLLPNVESGLMTQRAEVGIIQALESLNDTQVNEFLCGKAPLNLSMRLGDHMILIQLQLSTVAGAISTPVSEPLPSSSRNTLLQASRNLQHTLKKLSTDVFSNKDQGRLENVYSGTFSGSLNPLLQDTKGQPRRDVSTIVHILNDLLCSVPEFQETTREKSVEPAPVLEQLKPSSCSCSVDQDLRTRGKLEQLRLVMDKRRERRRMRKEKPYSIPTNDPDTVTA